MRWQITTILLAMTFVAQPATAQCRDNPIECETDTSQADSVSFTISCSRAIEGTVHFQCLDMRNAEPSHTLPYDFVLTRPYNKYCFMRISRIDPGKPWYWSKADCRAIIGAPSQLRTVDYIYTLPYSSNQHFEIGQSYKGTYSHQAGTPEEYAVDIVMPQGTPVQATRPGKVIAFRYDSNSGGDDKKFIECANYVQIKHDDGTYAAYVHLRQNGVTVKLGQMVAVGTTIGYSGATGWVSAPHLHFMVYRVRSATSFQTIPFRTYTRAHADSGTTDSVVSQLETGEIY